MLKVPGNCDQNPAVISAKPNWNHWSNIAAVELWEAVALSLDVEPELILNVNPKEFQKRIVIALRCFRPSENLGFKYMTKEKPHRILVYLSDFLRFGNSRIIDNFSFPKEFHRAAQLSRELKVRANR